jgi:predicted unusual protein kinase regulating ubiquinone biosynthesis (AarF/ABC1/UbiB family)
MPDVRSQLKQQLLAADPRLSTSSLGRLWRGGRTALGLGSQLWRSQRGDALDVEAIAQAVRSLGELRGVAMKLGQMLSYVDHSVPAELRSLLSLLQTHAPTTPFPQVAATLRTSLGEERAAALLAGLAEVPLAVASIGQVHRCRLPDGRDVVVKVLHPGIADAIAADFRSAALGQVVAAIVGTASVPEMIAEARGAFLEECDLGREAEQQARFFALFAADPTIVIPGVEPGYSAAGVLVSQYLPGLGLDDFLARGPSQAERDRAGQALFRFWLRTLYSEGLFHADPHPGNFAFRQDGRIVLYDFGCVRRFDPRLRQGFARLAEATRRDDPAAMAEALAAIGSRPPQSADSRARVRRLLRGFFAPLLSAGRRAIALDEGAEGREVLKDKRAILDLGLPARTLFLFRLRFGLYAVLARLGAQADWSSIEQRWAAEAALR